MNLRTRYGILIAALGLWTWSTPARADHINGHEDCDLTFPMPIPGQEHFNGGVLFVTLIGPIEDYVITNTTFTIRYVSDGATPASELQLHGTAMVDGGFAKFVVTGEDLGFGSGPGVFQGSFQTDVLNGVAWPSFFFPPYSIVDLQIDAVSGGIQGNAYFENSFITCDVIPAPPCAPRCPGDLNGDDAINAADLALLLGAWGPNRGHIADLNEDGAVNAADLALLLGGWGPC